jgi:MYXO-CTERM domain-containing protein
MRWTALLPLAALATFTTDAAAICRVVEDPEAVPPQIQPNQSVLFIKRSDVPVGDCGGDGGADAGVDAGLADAGVDAGLAEPCEVLDEAITLVVQPQFNIGADGSSFALLMVTPAPPAVRLERIDLFQDLARVTAPDIDIEQVEVEDSSLGYQCDDPLFKSGGSGCGGGGWSSGGGGGDFTPPPPPPDWDDPALDTILTIGPYEVVSLAASDGPALRASLEELGYVVDSADIDAIAPYLALGWTAIAVRVAIDESLKGGLQPLSLTYPGTEMRLPLGVSRQSEPAETVVALYASAEGRYDFPGATISFAGRTGRAADAFLTRSILISQLDQGPEADPIAFRVEGDPEVRETITVRQEIRIPSSECPSSGRSTRRSSGCLCSHGDSPGAGGLLLFGLAFAGGAAAMRRRR